MSYFKTLIWKSLGNCSKTDRLQGELGEFWTHLLDWKFPNQYTSRQRGLICSNREQILQRPCDYELFMITFPETQSELQSNNLT